MQQVMMMMPGRSHQEEEEEEEENHAAQSPSTSSSSSPSPSPASASPSLGDIPASSEGIFFEGAEKVLEITFKGIQRQHVQQGLRLVNKEIWQEMLSLVRCQILSSISNDHHDAYLLR